MLSRRSPSSSSSVLAHVPPNTSAQHSFPWPRAVGCRTLTHDVRGKSNARCPKSVDRSPLIIKDVSLSKVKNCRLSPFNEGCAPRCPTSTGCEQRNVAGHIPSRASRLPSRLPSRADTEPAGKCSALYLPRVGVSRGCHRSRRHRAAPAPAGKSKSKL